jgi:methylmalonyl-CoA mutase cobalamin-binding domain/chain
MMVEKLEELKQALINGKKEEAEELTKKALEEGISGKRLISEVILPASKVVGDRYEHGEFFLSELIQYGDTLESIMVPIMDHLKKEIGDKREERVGRILLATVKGDLHDIGKNIVRLFLEGNGFEVDDLGVDVPASEIIDKAVNTDADVIALSCLMSVTRDGVKEVIEELNKRGLRSNFAVLVGGRSTNEKWAKQIGADKWAPDAIKAVEAAFSLIKQQS